MQGHIPAWAAGSLYRTGPGTHVIENMPNGKTFETSHWFDGFAHSHKFDIIPSDIPGKPTRIVYSSRRQSEEMVENIRRTGSRGWVTFAQRQDPCVGLFSKIMSVWRRPPRDVTRENVCVAIMPAPAGKVAASAAGPPDPKAANRHDDGSSPGVKLGASSGGHRPPLLVTTDNDALKLCSADDLSITELSTQGKYFHPDLSGPLSCAHALFDPENGDMYNFNVVPGRVATYRVFCVRAATGQTDIIATIVGDFKSGPKAAYIHSFFMSANFIILCVPSAHYAWGGAKVLWTRNIAEALEGWDDGTEGLRYAKTGAEKEMQWLVIDRKGGRGLVGRFASSAGFFFHAINAYEEPVDNDGEGAASTTSKQVDIICDLVAYRSLEVVKTLFYDVLLDKDGSYRTFFHSRDRAESDHATLSRFRLRVDLPEETPTPGVATAPSVKTLADFPPPFRRAERILAIPAPHCGELPVINPAYLTRPYHYVYSVPDRGLSTLGDGLVKTDLLTRDALFWNNAAGHSPGEAVFVARPRTEEEERDGVELDEDDGVLLSVVLDGRGAKSYLVCLDAKTMRELGRAEADFAIAFGFHGCHVK